MSEITYIILEFKFKGEIMNYYEINDETMAVIPIDYDKTKIIEKEKEYIIEKKAYTIMDESCKYYGSSYKGRIEASKELLNCSYKLPIIVEESSALIFFPIKSSLLQDCSWINVNCIKNIEKIGNKCNITLRNGKKILLDISKLSLENQIYRSSKLESIIYKRIITKKRD
jgi:competence protein ComK